MLLKQICGYLCNKINVDEIGVACDTYGNDENRIQFFAGKHEGKQQLGHLSVVLRTAFKWILKK